MLGGYNINTLVGLLDNGTLAPNLPLRVVHQHPVDVLPFTNVDETAKAGETPTQKSYYRSWRRCAGSTNKPETPKVSDCSAVYKSTRARRILRTCPCARRDLVDVPDSPFARISHLYKMNVKGD